MTKQARSVKRRNEEFAQRTATQIWRETPAEENPYIAAECRCHGFELIELLEKRSFVDMFFLLFRGDLPTADQANLLERLMIALINPGPRHPATRAAMTAGVSKTDTSHILPIALNVLSGSHLGTKEVEDGMHFFREVQTNDPELVAAECAEKSATSGDTHPAPGFGKRFGGIDRIPRQIGKHLAELPGAGKSLIWGCAFDDALHPYGMGWLATGVAAAVFSDLGFQTRAGAGLYQIISAPGLLAHGVEKAYEPLTAMPFPADEDYVIDA